MSTFGMPISQFAYGLEITGDLPAVDHHSHAAYVRPGERLETFDALETEIVAGYVESRMPSDEHQRFVAANRSGDHVAAERLADQYRIHALREQAKPLYAMTAFSRALTLGCNALYGEGTRDEQTARARGRLDDYRALYDDALAISGTTSALTDVPNLDSRAWPRERYLQIARVDPYMYPFGHDPYVGRGFDAQRFGGILQEKLVEELGNSGLTHVPTTLDRYLDFVKASLQRRRDDGVVGLKVVSAYVRALDFDQVSLESARHAFEVLRTAAPGTAHPAARKDLSDFIIEQIAHQAIELDLPVQIHSGIGHSEPGLRLANANPMLLERFLNVPTLNRLRVILIHGGYPYSSQLGALAHSLGNVYLDFSWMPYLHTHLTRRVLQEWLEFLPAHKIAYGTDTAHPEIHVGATMLAREALEHVLQEGLSDRLWTPSDATRLAERVLSKNVTELYGLTE